MSRINSSTALSRLLLCLFIGAVSSIAAQSQAISGDSHTANLPSYSEDDVIVRWGRIAGLITAPGVSTPVAGIASGTTPWTTTVGEAAVDLTNGEAAFIVYGLVLDGGDATGTTGPVKSVKGALVCNPGATDQEVTYTGTVPLDTPGNAVFSGHLEKVPPSACSNPLFLILNAAKNVWIGTGSVRTTQTVR
jgi:hypothetical protein